MFIDLKYFDVYYFCQIANVTVMSFNYLTTNSEFLDNKYSCEPENFPEQSVLKDYCIWLINRVLYEQASRIGNGKDFDIDPIQWINQAIKKYKNIKIDANFDINKDDYLDSYIEYTDYLDKYESGLFDEIIFNIAENVEYVLFQNRDFLLRFNELQSTYFEDNIRQRVRIPKWAQKAIFYRDNGRCVLCGKDLTNTYHITENKEIQYDHIVPLAEGGLNDVCNLQLCCAKCNNTKHDTAKTGTYYQKAYFL